MLTAVKNQGLARDLGARPEDDVGLSQFSLDLICDAADGRKCHRGMHAENALDFGRVHVEAGRQDHVFLSVNDRGVTVFIHRRDIAGMKPAIGTIVSAVPFGLL